MVDPRESGGFGSRLIQQGIAVQLRGSIDCDWDADGAIVTIRMDRRRLAR